MEFLFGIIEQGLSFIIPLVILLGLLIFVHEMGHFLVAKFYGVRVEVFSLGFGKKIFQFKKGDTEYCLSIVPFGGYVKMYGDDPTADIPEDQKAVSFLHKPVGQRIAVVLAGPLMNFFFAILLFFIISMAGEQMINPVVGSIKSDSKAYTSGFRPGDKIVEINGEKVSLWEDVKKKIEYNFDGELNFAVKRQGVEEPVTFTAKTEMTDNPNILSTEDRIGGIQGLTYMAFAPTVGIRHNSVLYKEGLRPLDEIKSVNGKSVETFYELAYIPITPEMTFEVLRKRDTESEPEAVTITASIKNANSLMDLGIEPAGLFVSGFSENSPAKASGLMRGDKLVQVGGEKLNDWEELVGIVSKYEETSGSLNVQVLREGEIREFNINPTVIERTTRTGAKEKSYALGVFAGAGIANLNTTLVRTLNPIKAIGKGVTDTLHWTKITCLSFVRLIQNKVSARSIGGPIMIGQLASKTFQVGLSPFLKIMAIISINLFILNLLPVPVLDGGHLVFFSIEALRGAPLSMRKMEIAQQIGLVLLFGLMALAIFNDVTRLFE